MSVLIAVDPGLTGALAIFADGAFESVHDLPAIHDKHLAWIDGNALQSLLLDALQGRTARAVVERVGSMPGQGIASAFKFGVGFGSVLSVLQAFHIGIDLVTPGSWKRALGLGRDKNEALHRARLLFPSADLSLSKHHGRAEALLIGHWALTAQRVAA